MPARCRTHRSTSGGDGGDQRFLTLGCVLFAVTTYFVEQERVLFAATGGVPRGTGSDPRQALRPEVSLPLTPEHLVEMVKRRGQ